MVCSRRFGLSLVQTWPCVPVMSSDTLRVVLPGYRASRYDVQSKLKSLRRDKAGLLRLNAVLVGISLDGVRTGLICLL